MGNSKIGALTELTPLGSDDYITGVETATPETIKFAPDTAKDYAWSGFLEINSSETEVIDGAGAITPEVTNVIIESFSGVADNLDTITTTAGIVQGVLLLQAKTGHTITVRHAIDNINLNGAANKVLDDPKDMLLLFEVADNVWVQLAYSDNA